METNMETNMETALRKFIKSLNLLEPIKSDYREIRIWLQREGHTTITAEKVTEAPSHILSIYLNFANGLRKFKKEIFKFGFSEYNGIVDKIIKEELIKIEKEFPLIDEL
jgi:hypothetical protein